MNPPKINFPAGNPIQGQRRFQKPVPNKSRSRNPPFADNLHPKRRLSGHSALSSANTTARRRSSKSRNTSGWFSCVYSYKGSRWGFWLWGESRGDVAKRIKSLGKSAQIMGRVKENAKPESLRKGRKRQFPWHLPNPIITVNT